MGRERFIPLTDVELRRLEEEILAKKAPNGVALCVSVSVTASDHSRDGIHVPAIVDLSIQETKYRRVGRKSCLAVMTGGHVTGDGRT